VTFENALIGGSLHNLPCDTWFVAGVTAEELIDVYVYRMARKGAPGRPVYDRLMAAPRHGRCPYCAQRTVSTLDHYLAKATCPALAVVPINLVPCCADCNKLKGDNLPNSGGDRTLHPYFDRFDVRWLEGRVEQIAPAVVRFGVARDAGLDAALHARLEYHFKIFRLDALYSSHAAEELLNIRQEMELLFSIDGMTSVRESLKERAASCDANDRNSWQAATYRALAGNDWYCGGGFGADS
jgi:hypothetical protein